MVKDDLEYLLKKSARLILWYNTNQNDRNFQNYYATHFHYIRTLGYIVSINPVCKDSVEVFFKSEYNPEYRTRGEIIRYIK